MALYRCAACGSPNVVTDTQAGGIKYNYVKGAIGTVALGAGGAAAGISSDTQKVFVCPDCGVTLTYAMPQDMKNLIDLGVMSAEARKNLTFMGTPVTWDFILSKYKNIESGLGDRMAAEEAEEKRLKALKGMELLKSKGTATKEEFEAAVDQIDGYTLNEPTTLADYLSVCQAVEIFIENFFKFFSETEDFDTEYRGRRLKFRLCDYLPFYLHIKLCEKYNTNNVFLLSFKDIGDCIIDNPFLTEFCSISISKELIWMRSSYYDEEKFKQGIKKYDSEQVGKIVLKGIIQNRTVTLHNLWFKVSFDDIWRPYFMVRDGALYYWDASFKTSPLHDVDSDDFVPTIKNNYFTTYPEKKTEYDAWIQNYERIDTTAKQKETTIDNYKERVKYLKGQIDGASYEISVLQNKVFGKKQAAEQIAYHKQNISAFQNELQYLESEIARLNNEPKPISKEEYDKLLYKHFDCFIVWHRVEAA